MTMDNPDDRVDHVASTFATMAAEARAAALGMHATQQAEILSQIAAHAPNRPSRHQDSGSND